jgi:hypothetical protein
MKTEGKPTMNIRPRAIGLSAALLTLVASMATISGMAHAQPPAGQVKLLFSDDQDVADVWGKLCFGATPMRRLRDCVNPGFALVWCMRREDGAWDVLAQRYQEDETVRDAHQKKRTWTVVRATTRDGEHFENVQPLFGTAPGSAIEPGRWTDHLYAMEQDRITYVGAAANAEFSTAAFRMPEADLVLNTAVPAPDRAFAKSQAYVMVAVLDEQGNVIPGFEREHCVIQDCNRTDQPLRWKGGVERSARELAGRTIRLRFYLRGANVYAVTSLQ